MNQSPSSGRSRVSRVAVVGDRTIAWLAAEYVHCNAVEVPPVARKKWQPMLTWLLEDKCLDASEDLQIASAERQSDGRVPLVAMHSADLQAARREPRVMDREVDAWVPEFFALPWQPDTVSLACLDDRCVVRYGRWEGMAGDRDFVLDLVSRLLLKPGADGAALQLSVCYQEARPELPPHLLEHTTFVHEPRLFAALNGDYLAVAGQNRRRSTRSAARPAIAAAALCACLLLLLAMLPLVETRALNAQAEQIEQQLRTVYRQAFAVEYTHAMANFRRVAGAQLQRGVPDAHWQLLERQLSVLEIWLADCGDCQVRNLRVSDQRLVIDVQSGPQTGILPSLAGYRVHKTESGWQLASGLMMATDG